MATTDQDDVPQLLVSTDEHGTLPGNDIDSTTTNIGGGAFDDTLGGQQETNEQGGGGGGGTATATATAITLAKQNSMVAKALDHVAKIADEDESLRWESDPVTEAARSQALAEMMGLRPDNAGSHAIFRDASLHRARRSKDMVEAIRGCRTFQCVKMAHTRPPGLAKFNFPHFLMIGWQKTATTSLFAHLNQHPEISRPWDKEPEFFSERCGYDVPAGCKTNDTEDYIYRVLRSPRYAGFDGKLAQYEASTHYSRNGHRIAAGVFELFPWVKIVASLRDPISRAASMLVHLVDKNITANGVPGGCLAQNNMDLGYCLINQSHIRGDDQGGPTEYYLPLKAWVDAFPPEQVLLLQYEELTNQESERNELVRLKEFIGINPKLPRGAHDLLGMNNARKGRINPDGWPMKKDVYEKIIEIVRPDVEAVVKLVDDMEFGNGTKWMENWQQVWDTNLASCNEQGDCIIQLS